MLITSILPFKVNTVCANIKQQILPLNIQFQVNPLPLKKVVTFGPRY